LQNVKISIFVKKFFVTKSTFPRLFWQKFAHCAKKVIAKRAKAFYSDSVMSNTTSVTEYFNQDVIESVKAGDTVSWLDGLGYLMTAQVFMHKNRLCVQGIAANPYPLTAIRSKLTIVETA
jgi:hypothetical protein